MRNPGKTPSPYPLPRGAGNTNRLGVSASPLPLWERARERGLSGLTIALAAAQVSCALISPNENRAPRPDYAPGAQALESFIAHEMADKQLPALSIALVDDQQTVWARGFGLADPEKKAPATAATVYRVGPVSKLFNAVAVMQLVEQNRLDLDAPLTRYLPDFQPRNPFGKPVTLRQILAHQSGLARESPVGSYFDPTEPTLAQTVASLNDTALVYAPGVRNKYSNAAVAAAGHVVERIHQEPYAKALRRTVFAPLGMTHSSFELTAAINRRLAKAVMQTVDGRESPAPSFELGIAPATGLYMTVTDGARFISALFAGGQGPNQHMYGRVLEPATLAQMWTPQFPKPGEKTGPGLGFGVADLDGHRVVGHSGATYGFATALRAMPDDKLGVVVATSKDVAYAVTQRIALFALRSMLAARAGQPLPQPEITAPVTPELAQRLAGSYRHGARRLDLFESAGGLALCCNDNGQQVRLRMLGAALVADDRHAYGEPIAVVGNALKIGDKRFARIAAQKPKPAPASFRGLIGEYGGDHNILYIFERHGQLWSLIEWTSFYPLKQISANRFAFPQEGLYPGEQLVFARDAGGKASQVTAAGIVFKRRALGPEGGVAQLHVKPLRPVDELLTEALAAQPPKERGEFVTPDLVEPARLEPGIKLDIRYATTNNFLGSVFYSEPRAFLQRAPAEAVVRVHRKLKKSGYGLLIHDAYRPWYVTKVFWDAMPDDKKIFVAKPWEGSRHNRGAAVDLTMYDLKTGQPVEMVGTYDETTDRSFPDYPGGTSLQRWRRDLLRKTMESEGFTVYPVEWWHFDFMNWQQYPIANVRFDRITPRPAVK